MHRDNCSLKILLYLNDTRCQTELQTTLQTCHEVTKIVRSANRIEDERWNPIKTDAKDEVHDMLGGLMAAAATPLRLPIPETA